MNDDEVDDDVDGATGVGAVVGSGTGLLGGASCASLPSQVASFSVASCIV